MEQHRIQRRLLELGVIVSTSTTLVSARDGATTVACTYTEAERDLPCDTVVLVTARLPGGNAVHRARRALVGVGRRRSLDMPRSSMQRIRETTCRSSARSSASTTPGSSRRYSPLRVDPPSETLA